MTLQPIVLHNLNILKGCNSNPSLNCMDGRLVIGSSANRAQVIIALVEMQDEIYRYIIEGVQPLSSRKVQSFCRLVSMEIVELERVVRISQEILVECEIGRRLLVGLQDFVQGEAIYTRHSIVEVDGVRRVRDRSGLYMFDRIQTEMHFPQEIWGQIIRYLDPASAKSLSQTCTLYYNIVKSTLNDLNHTKIANFKRAGNLMGRLKLINYPIYFHHHQPILRHLFRTLDKRQDRRELINHCFESYSIQDIIRILKECRVELQSNSVLEKYLIERGDVDTILQVFEPQHALKILYAYGLQTLPRVMFFFKSQMSSLFLTINEEHGNQVLNIDLDLFYTWLQNGYQDYLEDRLIEYIQDLISFAPAIDFILVRYSSHNEFVQRLMCQKGVITSKKSILV